MAQSPIPKASELELDIGGFKTYVACINYVDKFFVVVSQLQTFGTMISASVDSNPDGSVSYTIQTLMGKRDEDMLTLCARRLIEKIGLTTSTKPLVLCLALRPESETIETVKQVVQVVESIAAWPTRTRSSGSSNSSAEHHHQSNTGAGAISSTDVSEPSPRLPGRLVGLVEATETATAFAERDAAAERGGGGGGNDDENGAEILGVGVGNNDVSGAGGGEAQRLKMMQQLQHEFSGLIV